MAYLFFFSFLKLHAKTSYLHLWYSAISQSLYLDEDNFVLQFSDIYFIGGFGTVAWVDVKEYEALKPDKIAVDAGEQNLKVDTLFCFI